MLQKVYLAFGGNLGRVPATFKKALIFLQSSNHFKTEQVSSLYISRSLLKDDQPDYYNIIVKGKTDLDPVDFLMLTQQTEKRFGRVKKKRWGARRLDIDIVDYEGVILCTDLLVLPHGQLSFRSFVLLPLQELSPDYVHPLSKKPIQEMIDTLEDRLNIQKSGDVIWP